jgi:hypothetical protein
MARGVIIVAPNDVRDRMVLRMVINGSFPVTAELGTAQADDLFEKVSRARAALHDKRVSDEGPLTVLEFAAVNPTWRASPHVALKGPDANSIALGLRHPVYGWLSFVLPDKDARALGEWLLSQVKDE